MADPLFKDPILLKAVENAVYELVRFEHGATGSFIHLPLWLSSGTSVAVVVRRGAASGTFDLSDDCAVYREAEDFGLHKSFSRIASQFAIDHCVHYEDKEFKITGVRGEQIAGAACAIGEAARLAFDAASEKAAERQIVEANELFYVRLLKVFEGWKVDRERKIRGASQHEWKFLNVVTKGGHQTIFEPISPQHMSVYTAVTKFHDVRQLENAPRRVSVVADRKAMGDYIGLLSQVSSVIDMDIPDETLKALAA